VTKIVCSRGRDRTEAIKEPVAMKRISQWVEKKIAQEQCRNWVDEVGV
jgi:hypothetical protein